MRLFTLFPNLITKESYNWWVTRRFWGFRQQISKAKYLKISQNIGGKYQEASGEHRSTVKNGCSPIRVDAIRWSGYVRPEKLKRLISHPAPEFRTWTSGWKWQQPGTNWRQPGAKWRQPGANWRQPGANPIRICGPNALRWYIRTPCPGIFLAWIPKNSPPSQISLVIIKLSKHQNLTQFD